MLVTSDDIYNFLLRQDKDLTSLHICQKQMSSHTAHYFLSLAFHHFLIHQQFILKKQTVPWGTDLRSCLIILILTSIIFSHLLWV